MPEYDEYEFRELSIEELRMNYEPALGEVGERILDKIAAQYHQNANELLLSGTIAFYKKQHTLPGEAKCAAG